MTWATHHKVRQPLGEVQNVHASLVRMQYLTYSMHGVCNDGIAMVLRWEGPMTRATHDKDRQPLGEVQNVQPHQYMPVAL